ncbi:MAG TPA: hypothetical protein VMT12_06260 [Syntrophales bacterium]|nr:hypothetical protein [Syntrophales bacterium]
MSKLELAPDEEKELLAILERYIYDLRVEIVNTDDREFRKFLRKREEFMRGLIERLKV